MRTTIYVHVLAASLVASNTFAQPRKEQAPATPPTSTGPASAPASGPAGSPGFIEFSDKVVRLESAGLSMKLPIKCQATTNAALDASSIQIIPDDSTWLVQIESPRTSRVGITLKEVCDAMIAQTIAASGEIVEKNAAKKEGEFEFGTRTNLHRGQVIERQDDLKLPGWPAAARFYVETYPDETAGNRSAPDADGNRVKLAVIRGFTIVQVASDRFVTFDMRTPKPNFADVKRTYETMLATSTFVDPGKMQTGRKAALEGGMAILQRFDAAALKELIDKNPERWQRLFISSKTGAASDDTELGYRRIRCAWGKRGQLDPARKESQYTSVERQEGLVVWLDARVLDIDPLSPTRKIRQVIDSASVFFMSPDRQQEAWVTRNAKRDGKTTSQITEIGSRNVTDMIVSVTANGDAQQVRPIIQGDLASSGYLSQAEARILPLILISKRVPTEYGYYVWNSAAQAIKLRRDVLEELSDGSGSWKITTRATEDSKPETVFFNEKGDFLRTEMPNDAGDTMRWEPISLERLVSIWKQKNLPME